MPAVVIPIRRARSRAWCAEHQDGVNTTPQKAADWADAHNRAEHGNTDAQGMVSE